MLKNYLNQQLNPLRFQWNSKTKRGVYISLLVLLMAFLAACENEVTETEKMDTFLVKDISFESEEGFLEFNQFMFVDTEEETLVIDLENIKFIKSNEPNTTIDVKWLSNKKEYPTEWIEGTLLISEDKIPGISKKYAKKYLTTISFEEKKQE